MSLPQRRLVLMRHAKAAWPPGVVDAERPLALRGIKDAPVAGRWIAEHVGAVDLLVVSPAERTRQTADLVTRTWAQVPPVRWEERIYEATKSDIEMVIGSLPHDARTVAIIGHSPGLEEVASSWPHRVSRQADEQLQVKFPTSAIAVVHVAGPWSAPMDSETSVVVVPRG